METQTAHPAERSESVPTHPEEIEARIDFCIGSASLQATARATPAGFVCVELMVSAILVAKPRCTGGKVPQSAMTNRETGGRTEWVQHTDVPRHAPSSRCHRSAPLTRSRDGGQAAMAVEEAGLSARCSTPASPLSISTDCFQRSLTLARRRHGPQGGSSTQSTWGRRIASFSCSDHLDRMNSWRIPQPRCPSAHVALRYANQVDDRVLPPRPRRFVSTRLICPPRTPRSDLSSSIVKAPGSARIFTV